MKPPEPFLFPDECCEGLLTRRTLLKGALAGGAVLAGASVLSRGTAVAGPAAPAQPNAHFALEAIVRARQLFFGAENVDAVSGAVRKDLVIISWLSNTTYAVSIKGRIFLLDSFVTRLEVTPGRTPFVIQDIVDMQPEAIFLGHGHGDHADNAAYIAHQVGIPIFTSPETCDVMQLDAARIFGPGTTVDCREVVSRGSEPGAEVVSLDILEPEVGITAFKHIHSATVPTDPDNPVFAPVNNIPDPRDADLFPPGQPLSSVLNLRTTGFGGAGGRVSLFYQFVVRGHPNFTLVWHNTGGPLKEQAPQLIGLLESLPKTDVELGSVVTLGFGTNGLRDPVTYMRLIRPKIFIPGHLTAVARESSSLEWRDAFLKEIDILNIPKDERPDIRWVVDPTDYIRPMVFDPKAARWAS